MGIEAKGSSGTYAECPECHHVINHGFQVCQSCGHTVSAEEQSAMQKLLIANVFRFAFVTTIVFALAFYFLGKF
ncbi:MAG: hypothetical protein U5L46_15260 [Agrobacterium sp.]|nr:hypothetical protein [Agrobacterium sp.]